MPQSIGRSGSELRRRKAGNHQEVRINSEEVTVRPPLAFFCNTEAFRERARIPTSSRREPESSIQTSECA
jgi:hypothetical protein